MKTDTEYSPNLIWNVSPLVTGLKFGMPPVDKIRDIVHRYVRHRLTDIFDFYGKYSESINRLWRDKDIRFTKVDGKPAYTKTSNRSDSKKGRRITKLIEDDGDMMAWLFHRNILELECEIDLLVRLLEVSIWSLKADVYTIPKVTKDVLSEYEQLYNQLHEMKEALYKWRKHREEPVFPKWAVQSLLP